jgi:glycosyltransferase involved in cell wall biosynthesis
MCLPTLLSPATRPGSSSISIGIAALCDVRVSLSRLSPSAIMVTRTVIQVLDFIPRSWRSMEQFLLALAGKLRENGWRTVHVFAGEPGPRFRGELDKLESPCLVGKFPLTGQCGRDLGRQLWRFRPAVIQTHFLSKFDRGLRPLKRCAGVRRLIVTDHSSGMASRKSRLGCLLAWLRGRWAGTYIDQIVAVSEFVRRRDAAAAYFPAAKIRVVHNGVDTSCFVPTDRRDNDVFTIAFAGQLISEKGVLTLLRAVRHLTAAGRAVRVRIAGHGQQKNELQEFCAAAGLAEQVDFLGQIDMLPQLFAGADVVVIPSEWEEAFSFVAAEAAACGACLLVSDAGALPEVIGQPGKAGLIFAKGNAADLAGKLKRLMDDKSLRERLGLEARQRITSLFSIEQMVGGYAQLFDEIVSSEVQ